MAVSGIHLRTGLLLACFFFLLVTSQFSDPYFMVTFPAVIESGSEAKFCVSLLNPNETLSMNIYLIHTNQTQTIFQDKVEEEFHRCSQFQAPLVEEESVQQIKVEVKGEDFQMTETRKVLFKSYDLLTLIQTDKPIYNPGQTVNFRLVTMDSSFVPLEQEYSVVVLEDNNNNRIGQWTNVSSEGKILQLSHQLNPEAAQGTYRLIAYMNNKQTSHHFKVKKYVLPKFEITLKMPERHSVEKEDLKIEVCGKYTYGQALAGKAEVQVCRQFRATYFQGPLLTPCMTETVELTTTGCGSLMFNVSHFLNSQFEENFADSIEVSATATEEGTDISMTKSESIALSFEIGKIIFLDLPKVFERGAVIKGKVKMTNFDEEPIADKQVYILEGEQWSPKLITNLTTDINGLAEFSVNAPNEPVTQLKLWASTKPNMPYHPYKSRFVSNAEAYIPLFQPATPYSPVNSELHIENLETPITCGTEVPITMKYYVFGETTDNYSFDIIFMVLSKGIIVHHDFEKVEVKESKPLIEGKVSFRLTVATKMAPLVQIVAFAALPSKNIMASQRSFDVEKCFKNRVFLQFSPDKAVPGEENTLQLSAQPGSLCGLSAVDQSVFVMEPGQRLTIEKVFSLLPRTLVSGFHYKVEDDLQCLVVRPRRDIQANHAYETLKAVGLKMVTNLPVRQPHCLLYKGVQYTRHFGYADSISYRGVPMAMGFSGVGGTLMKNDMEPIETIRKFFPETWIWDLVKVGDSGSTQVPVTAPDTITTWETEVFCLSSEGFGLAPPAQLTVFQPFFLELSLPYSIIRGEVFELKATVFNYLSKCIMVKVTPTPSPDYKLEVTGDGQYSSCLCANGRKTFKWTLIASVLGALNVTVSAHAEQSQVMCDNEIVSVPERGRIDTVTRSLLVRAEGTEKTKSYSWLLCPQGKSVSEELELTLPDDVIEGSARASVSVLGDLLGRALKNIDGLLQMPYGCGEQNIALLAPNIYILKYLEKTGQLTTAIREKATGFLKSGYQRQLNYKHFSGAYSTFGRGEGNTWLTAFVLRTFGQAKHFIFIDEENLQLSKQWLITLQREHGCFSRQGRLFNNRMKGGVNDDVTMTAYIVASFLELNYSVEDLVIKQGLSCLKASLGNLTNTYATALLAYTFSLAGETEIRGQLLEKLNSVALSGDGRLHWSQSPLEDSDSLSVEITSYVLLATLTKDQHTTAELGSANRIVSWLVRQQNPFGGFSSTQDTVVALQALALYSTKIYSPDGSSTVTVKSASGETHHFDVTPNNKLVYQEKPLQNVLNKYSIEVEGSTCVSVGMALFYNVPTPPVNSTLRIEVMAPGICTKSFGQTLAVHFTVSYKGPQNYTNMVIVDIKVLSGFTADPTELRGRPFVERVDTKDDHILVYLKEIIKDHPLSYILYMKQVLPVRNLKPGVIKVYDYYQTSDQSETEYAFSCS